ncbi:MAG: hypothetical protein DRH26_00110 [Deltaproteobacteria bacterium]|nr:MAG: hypothetical protein DRH26_00110 [Deltaproteobacteria bacterium]
MIYRDNYDYLRKRSIYFKGGSSDSVDEVYNAGMLQLSEHQQEMADELFAFYKNGTGGSWEETQVETKAASTGTNQVWQDGSGRDGMGRQVTETYDIPAEYETQRTWVPDGTTNGYMDMEQAQIDANMELVPGETALSKAQIDANMELIPIETAAQESVLGLQMEQNTSAMELLPGQTALTQQQINAESGLVKSRSDTESAQLNTARIQANADRKVIGYDREARQAAFTYDKEKSMADLSLLPQQTALSAQTMADTSSMINERAPVRQAFYQEAQNGVNAEDRANRAAADAAHAFVNSNSTSRRDSARMGINPNSGRFTAMQTSNDMNRAKAIGGARTTARIDAENENFGRLQTAMNYGG